MNRYFDNRRCPVCNGDESKPIRKFLFELFEGHPMNGGYNVVQCNKCGFVYADTGVTQKELDDYYTNLSKYEDKNISTGGGFTQYDKDRLQATAQYISDNFGNKNIRILDIGCANGGLLRELKVLGFTDLTGVDPSSACVEITKNELGCPCFQHSLFDISEEIGTFDLIILSHVMEHILEVQDSLKAIGRLLNPDGSIYIECPNAENYKEVVHAPYQEFNTEHINHFNEVSFENLFGLNGYRKIHTGNKILKIASNQDYHAVYGIFQRAGEGFDFHLRFDADIETAIQEYLRKSDRIYSLIEEAITKVEPSRSIAFFGVGQFAFKLLTLPAIQSRKNIRLFDNNRLNVNKVINQKVVLPGERIVEEFLDDDFLIFITSPIHEDAIREGIRQFFLQHETSPPETVGFRKLLNFS